MIEAGEIKQKAAREKISPALVFKEYLHLAILDYFFRKGLFSAIVFQGGTALRLVYNGSRYSEDLDFVLRRKNAAFFKGLPGQLQPLPGYVEKFIPFARNVRLKLQKSTATFKRFHLSLEVEFLSTVDRTNIEIANVPSYHNQPMILRYPGVSFSPAVAVETPQEILADKITAFAARKYLKGRDIWDIYFIGNTLKIFPDKVISDMVRKKIYDYKMTMTEFTSAFKSKLLVLEKNGRDILYEEMDKFLPGVYRDMFKDKYGDICRFSMAVLKDSLKEF